MLIQIRCAINVLIFFATPQTFANANTCKKTNIVRLFDKFCQKRNDFFCKFPIKTNFVEGLL